MSVNRVDTCGTGCVCPQVGDRRFADLAGRQILNSDSIIGYASLDANQSRVANHNFTGQNAEPEEGSSRIARHTRPQAAGDSVSGSKLTR